MCGWPQNHTLPHRRSSAGWLASSSELKEIRGEPLVHPAFPRDPKDVPFIAAALASEADYLITGDKDLLDEQLVRGA